MTFRGALVNVGGKLGLPGKLTRVSWSVPKGCTFDQWQRAGKTLGEIEGAVLWWIGDWWAFGEHHFGERLKAIDPESGWQGPAFQTCMNAAWVSSRFSNTSRRREGLSFSHHAEVAGITDISRADWLLEQAEENRWSTRELRAEIAKERQQHTLATLDLPAGRYPVLYADPPWQYENPPMGGSNRSVENHYPTMALDAISALPVADLAADDAILYIWATAPKLAETIAVIDAWGFTYRTNIVWVKDKIGMGYHARSQHELLLIAKRGELPPPLVEDRVSSIVYAPRTEHSAKPAAFYELIERWYPTLPKVELFARVPRDGWTAWGNQLADAAQ